MKNEDNVVKIVALASSIKLPVSLNVMRGFF